MQIQFLVSSLRFLVKGVLGLNVLVDNCSDYVILDLSS